jgi:hypothetical protein
MRLTYHILEIHDSGVIPYGLYRNKKRVLANMEGRAQVSRFLGEHLLLFRLDAYAQATGYGDTPVYSEEYIIVGEKEVKLICKRINSDFEESVKTQFKGKINLRKRRRKEYV